MSNNIQFRSFQPADRPALAQIVRQVWEYDLFCTPKTAAKLAEVYLDSCLMNQTFTLVAQVDGTPAGIIMARAGTPRRRPLPLLLSWLHSAAGLLLLREGRAVCRMFGRVQQIDDRLLAGCGRTYPGELAFFAISPQHQGKGIGRMLFQSAVDYMHTQGIAQFYLFTDTSCNYPFYEHLGMHRRAEEACHFEIQGQQREMRFFLYEYPLPEEGTAG